MFTENNYHSHAHKKIIYNCPNIELPQISDRMDKLWYIYTIQWILQKEWIQQQTAENEQSTAVFNNMNSRMLSKRNQ